MCNRNHGLRPRTVALAVALALGLSGCGGGGGSNVRPSTPTPPPPTGTGDFAGGNINVGAGVTTVLPNDIAGSIDLIKGGAGTLVLTGTDSYTGGTTINDGTLQIGNGGTTGSITGNVVDNAFLVFDRSNNLTYGGIVSGTGSLEQAGAGTLTLTGTNTYTGGTTISDGTLRLGNGGTTGSIVGNVTNSGSLVFDRSNDLTYGGIVSGTGSLTQAGTGKVTLTGANTYTGGTTISSGVLQVGNGGASGSIVGNVRDNGVLAFDRSDDVSFAGTVTGTGSLTKAGGGSLTLTGANSYAGATQVTSGSLYVDGNQSAASGATTVASGATLGGKGTLGGDVTIGDGAILAPGDKGAIGTFAINGNLNLSAGSMLDYGFDGQLVDLINVKGNLTLNGTLNVHLTSGDDFGPGIYHLINYDGALVDNGLQLFGDASGLLVRTGVAHQVDLVNSQGMTLSFWDGDAGPKGNNAINGGSGTWESGNSLSNNNWTDAGGAVNTTFSDHAFAVFQAAPGTVNVDGSNGEVNAAGMQFASNGYVVQGGAIHLVGSADDPTHSIIRVGDGTAKGTDYTATINSVLNGTSALVKADAGTLVLGGANTYTGGTTISGGTLQIGNGGTTGSITGAVADNGFLVFDRSDNLSFNGIVSGTGSLRQAGTGTLTLTGANTYTGGTMISAGILQLGDGIHAGSIIGNITNNGSLVFNSSGDSSYAGVIGGSGSLTKSGRGRLILTGASTYAGGTSVLSDTLEIASGAPGSGPITLVYSGNQEVILRVDSAASIANHIMLQGATLDNSGSIANTADGSAVEGVDGNSGTILNHDGGSISGKNFGLMMPSYSIIKNSSGSVIGGGVAGVVLNFDGEIFNDGAGSVISSTNGIGIETSRGGTIQNTGGATIAGGSTAIYLQDGGVIVNDSESTIKTANTAGACQEAGGCAIFVATSASGAGNYLQLSNAGTIIGDVRMDPTGTNSVTLWAGGTIQGDLLAGPEGRLTLQGDAGTVGSYSNAVTGKSTLQYISKFGDGTWILDNNALATAAGVRVMEGTLQVGTGGTEGSLGQSDVSVDGTLVFARSDKVILPGTISGGGSLVQAGSGTLVLTSESIIFPRYIKINSGIVQVGDGGQPGSLYGDVLNNGSLVVDHSNEVVIGGSISGTGSLIQKGTGTLVLNAPNTYSGGTTISEGMLRSVVALPGNVAVKAAGALDSISYTGLPPGVLGVKGSLSNAGKVLVHGGNGTIAGNYSQASTGTLAVSLGSALNVYGTAVLNGGTLEVTGADSGYVGNAHTSVLTASGGLTGTFAQLVKDTGVVFTATTINYDGNSAWLDTTGLNVTTAAAGNGVSYTPVSLGSAQRVQGAFEQLDEKIAAGNVASVSGDFVRAAGQFQQAPTLQAAQASLQSLSGQLHAASAAMTFQAIDASSRVMSDRLDGLLGRGVGFGTWTQSLNTGGDMARAGFDDVGYQLNGWLVGSDRQVGRSGVAGYAFGQSQGQQRLGSTFDRDKTRSTEAMVYAGLLNGNWYTQGRVGFGRFQQDVSRQVLLGDSAQGVSTRYSGQYNVAYGESGLRFGRGNSQVTPFVDVEYTSIDRGGFSEQGAGGFGLRSNAQTLDRWQAGLGVRLGHHWGLSGGRALDFNARAQWQRTLAAHGDAFDASFVGLQQWQPLVGIGLSRYSGLLGVGIDATLSEHTALKFGYDYETGQHNNAQTASARLSIAF